MRRLLLLSPPLLVALIAAAVLASAPSTPADQTVDIDSSRRNAIVIAAERASPAIVAVGTVERIERGFLRGHSLYTYQELAPFPFVGSGVIIDGDEGLIVTNDHVIAGLSELLVTLPDGRQFDATLVGHDSSNDLALLRIPASDLPEIPLGTSDDLMIGEWVLAIGNPFGDLIDDPQPTVSIGVISALNRDFRNARTGRISLDMIQTDAGINPGNSGGALVNAQGELIGINSFIISPSGTSADIGFAIPVNRVRRVVDDLARYGQVRPVYRDFVTHTFRRRMAESTGVTHRPGAIVTALDINGPAAQAGLLLGDIVTRINGQAVTNSQEMEAYLTTLRVGEPIRLTVWRPDGEAEIDYELIQDRP
ncbi:trypsin-like peptidase domain-containing protein [Candidatus Sumerlaeota bacterium]|nr:trypsin-like peptidase domain-containing protein [Candidatus Sumerlaeota bacterium]